MKKDDIKLLAEAMRILARDTYCEDSVATLCMQQAADRLDEAMCVIMARIPVQCRSREDRFCAIGCRDCPHRGLCECLGGFEI